MNLSYKSAAKQQSIQFTSISNITATAAASAARAPAMARKASASAAREPARPPLKATEIHTAVNAVKSDFLKLHDAWNSIHETDTRYHLTENSHTLLIATDSMTVQGVTKKHIKELRDKLGFETVREGRNGKVLLRAPETNLEALKLIQKAINRIKRNVGAAATAHPHFVRSFYRPKPSNAGGTLLWNHNNTGQPGISGADVAAQAAWLISKGSKDIRVAVLDEGVDSLHPALKTRIVDEKDFVDGNAHARPDHDDAHGTACAGIICSQDPKYPGLAPECSLVGARIAKGDGNHGWIIDDFNTADAIDWCWEEANADVLSNSWGGGPAVDVIINAIARARTKGRGGKGSVVVFAAGNTNTEVHFPGNLDTVLTVGASNWFDERKSKVSKDGENWWGSCFGDPLDLLAPGVCIATTDISGSRGYETGNFTETFNGTSAATPHVAAAAAMVLAVKPELKVDKVEEILKASCDRLNANGEWHQEYGSGRLNIFSALRLAMR